MAVMGSSTDTAAQSELRSLDVSGVLQEGKPAQEGARGQVPTWVLLPAGPSHCWPAEGLCFAMGTSTGVCSKRSPLIRSEKFRFILA